MISMLRRLRWPVLGMAAATLVLTATALAGSGVGGVFNLGQTNTVDATSTLAGAPAAPQLTVKNTSTNSAATALNLSVAAGRAPFKINSGVKVTSLNADQLDGKDSTYFLSTAGTAANSNKLGGLAPTAFWKLGGNATVGLGVLGTTTNQSLDLNVNGQRAFHLQPDATSPNVIGGYSGNVTFTGIGTHGATIAGGGVSLKQNIVSDHFGTIGGGIANQAGDNDGSPTSASGATVAGGENNKATGYDSAIAGGDSNTASGVKTVVGGGQGNTASGAVAAVGGGSSNTATDFYATVAGGGSNQATSTGASVGGGENNQATQQDATVAGGSGNVASGQHSFASGINADATGIGSFVWNDSSSFRFGTSTGDTFAVHALNGIWLGGNALASNTDVAVGANRFIDTSTGGYLTTTGVWTSTSDRALKHDSRPLNKRSVLEKVARLPITSWSYKAESPSVRHIGPMAQDFYSSFGLGLDDKHIGTIDEGGVALAAIQGLYRQNLKLQRRVVNLERQVLRLSKSRSR